MSWWQPGRWTAALARIARHRRIDSCCPDCEAFGAQIATVYGLGGASKDEGSWRVRRNWQQAVDARVRVRLEMVTRDLERPRRSRPRWIKVSPLVAANILVISTAAAAAGNFVRLGRPTDDVIQTAAPLYGFRGGAPVLRRGGKVELLLFDTDWDPASAVDRWPVVKALSQFGTWSGLQQGASEPTGSAFRGSTGLVPACCPVPTFDLSSAHYGSPYVVLVHQQVQGSPKGTLRRLPPQQERLFLQFSSTPPPVCTSVVYRLPVVIVGGYGMHGSIEDPDTVASTQGGNDTIATQTFEGLRHAMQEEDEAPNISFIVREFNAYANVVSALICHADGMRPARVCSRPVMRRILKQSH